MDQADDSLDAGLRAVFRHRAGYRSVAEALGVESHVLLRDAPEGPTPVLTVTALEAVDDARYQILGEIARGGVGVVLKSRDRNLAREVALKVLRGEHAGNAEVLERFVEEAQVGGQLQHPGIVPVYGMGLQPDGRPYFAMKLVKGRTLTALLEERKDLAQGRRKFLADFEQICLTMAYAHARGVIHRDLKPSNAMIGAFGEVQIVDWGFAKVLGTGGTPAPRPDQTLIATVRSDKEGSHSVAGSVMGTPAYMPPEQALGLVDELDERTDAFALGGILCEILTGKPPYVGDDLLVQAAQARLDGAYARLDACGAEAELVALARRCLAPARAERPRDAGAVAAAITAQLAAAEERARRAELEAAEARAHEEEQHARLARQELATKQHEARAARERRQAERAHARQLEERRRVQAEHRRRLLTVGIAAVLVAAVAIGGAGTLVSANEEAARAALAETAVSDALQHALALEGAQAYSQARTAARGALDLAGDAEPATLARAKEIAARIDSELQRARAEQEKRARDERLLADLEAAALRAYDELEGADVDEVYGQVLRQYGIDVETQPPAEIAHRIRECTDPAQLAAHFDAWALRRRRVRRADWSELLEISRLGDPDPLRNQVRDALASESAAACRHLMQTCDGSALPVRTQVLLGSGAYTRQQLEAAWAFLRKVQCEHPGNVWANDFLGWALIDDRPEEGIRYLTAAHALYPAGMSQQVSLAVAQGRTGDVVRAEAMCRSMLERYPGSAWGHSALGYVRADQGDWKGAVAAAEEWCKVEPRASAYQLLGAAHAKLRDLDAALAASQEAVRIGSTCVSGRALNLQNLAVRLCCNNDWGKAAARAKEATDLLPEDARVWVASSYVPALQGHADQAIEFLRRALDCDRENAWANHIMGEVLLRWKDDLDGALAYLQKSVDVEPLNLYSLDSLADCHRYRGEPMLALQAIEQALLCDNSCAPAHVTRGCCFLMLGEFELAAECAETARVLDHTRSSAYDLLGEVSARQGRYADAVAAYQEALRPRTGHWLAMYRKSSYALHLATSLLRLGRFQEASAALREVPALEEEPHTSPLAPRERRQYGKLVRICNAILDLEAGLPPDPLTPARAYRAYFLGDFAEAVALFRPVSPEHRYVAACAAVRAGELDTALDCLRAELEAARQAGRVEMRLELLDWKTDPDLAPVRDPIPLAKLPDAARAGWVPFWNEVDALLAGAPEGS